MTFSSGDGDVCVRGLLIFVFFFSSTDRRTRLSGRTGVPVRGPVQHPLPGHPGAPGRAEDRRVGRTVAPDRPVDARVALPVAVQHGRQLVFASSVRARQILGKHCYMSVRILNKNNIGCLSIPV